VDLFAPYWVLIGADPDSPANAVRWMGGTSFSSPFVAGVAALVWAADPGLRADEVEAILLRTAITSSDPTVGRYVDAFAAVVDALGFTPDPPQIPSGYLTRQVVVPAGSEAPVATGVRTQPNDPLVITATGLWSNVGPPALGPGGWIGYKHPGTREEADLASLVGYFRVPGAGYASWIPIGAHFAGTSPTPITGTLALVMNDVWGTYADNQGSVTAFASFRGCAEVRVPANQPWTDTGIVAPPGTPFLVKATGGRWSNVGPPALDANGFVGYRHPGTVLESANLASLIGRIGNDVFPLGSYEDHGFATQDTLFLGMNDVPSTYGDNQGAIDVDVCYGWIIY
jgi:hypothetical protein